MPIAALAAPIMAAASTVTLSGLAMGATIIGTATQVIGMATGSKTLKKIGTGFMMAGGVGSAVSAVRGASALSGASRVSGSNAAKSTNLLKADNIDEMLAAPTKGTNAAKDMGLKTFDTPGGQIGSMNKFAKGSRSVGLDSGRGAYGAGGVDAMGNPAAGFDPELEKSFFQRASDTMLTPYNPLMNMIGGAGEAYMVNAQMEQRSDMQDKQLAFDQQLVDRTKVNNGTLMNIDPTLNITRNNNAYAPLLRG